MAIDEAILRCVTGGMVPPTLRFYSLAALRGVDWLISGLEQEIDWEVMVLPFTAQTSFAG